MEFRLRSPARAPLCLLAGLLLLPPALAAQRLSDDALLRNGVAAFQRLPASVTSADATLFANAVRYLFAYEQRDPPRMRQDPALARQVHESVAWLSRNLELTSPAEGKGDGPSRLRSTRALRTRGLALYGQLPASGPISGGDVVPFIQAFANLYAFQQCATADDVEVGNAMSRLERSVARLGQAYANGKADGGERSPQWAPRAGKPTLQHLPGVADGRDHVAPPALRARRNEARPR
jgi:hypothetical protein